MEYSSAVFGARNLYKKNLVQETMSDGQVSCIIIIIIIINEKI